MKRLLFIVTIAWMTLCAKAQNITGNVQDEQKKPIEFANVALYSLPDSTLITGTITDSKGNFLLKKEVQNKTFIKVSFLGYETRYMDERPHQVIVLKNDTQLLGEVAVVATRPSYRLERGALVASVKNTSLANMRNATDVLSQLPFLTEKDGEFTVFGKGKPLIYINNRQVRDTKELEQLSPANIKQIRVITTPGAEYDSSVRAVIKITTERPIGEGLSGSFKLEGRQNKRFSTNGEINLNYRTGAWDFFGEVYSGQYNSWYHNSAIQELTLPTSLRKQVYDITTDYKYKNLGTVAGINFNPNPNHSAGIRYTRNGSTNRGDAHLDILHTGQGINERLIQDSKDKKDNEKHHINAYYNGKLSKAFSLNFNTDIVTGDETTDQISTRSNGTPIATLNKQDYDLYAGKAVLTYNIGKSAWSGGGEYTYTTMEQSYGINDPSLGIPNSGNKSVQNRGAAFLTYETQLGRWGVSAGLRYEDIKMDYHLNGVLSPEQSRHYRKLFPNLTISYAGDKLQTSVSYARSISYPSYSDLRSNVQYLSPFVYQSGNPLLRPTITNSFTWMLTKGGFQAMGTLTFSEDPIEDVVTLYQGKPIVLMVKENLDRSIAANLSLSYNTRIGCWSPRWEVYGMLQKMDYPIAHANYNKPFIGGTWSNTFTLPHEWMIRFNLWGQTSGHYGAHYAYSKWAAHAHVTKTFLKRRLTANLAVNNLFNSLRFDGATHYDKVHFYSFNKAQTNVMLTLTYRFNSTQSKYKGKQASDELNRL